jgi:NADPH:quinone reductase-like Zn-dependent oxidoreductase
MKAIHITSFVKDNSELIVRDIPAPVLKQDQVLVNITHSALNHVDLLYARGKHQNNHSGLVSPPFTLGLEFSGTIASAPHGSGLKQGDEVWGGGLGGFAEQIAVPVTAVQRIPEGWSLHDAAGLAATAPVSYGALVKCAGIKPGQTLLVHAAAGGLGVVAVQIAHALGVKVIGTVGSEDKAQAVRKLGAMAVVRYDKDDWEKEVMKITNGIGVDSVYDTVGLVLKSIRCLKFGGNIVIAGFAGREGVMETLAMNRVLLKNVKLLGYVSLLRMIRVELTDNSVTVRVGGVIQRRMKTYGRS